MEKFMESDLYGPVSDFLVSLGYEVKSEVKDCDIAARRGDDLLIVEMKRAFNLKLVYQAIDRQKLCPDVFVAIPRPQKGQRDSTWRNMTALLRRLDLGLITVALESETKNVEVVLEPGNGKAGKNREKKKLLLSEFDGRSGEYNKGGVSRKKIVTAYREKSIELACALMQMGQCSPKELRELGFEEKCVSILRANYYKWFERVEKGVYTVSEKGREEVLQGEFQRLGVFYLKKYQKDIAEEK